MEKVQENKFEKVLKGLIIGGASYGDTGLTYKQAEVLAEYLSKDSVSSILEDSFEELFYHSVSLANKLAYDTDEKTSSPSTESIISLRNGLKRLTLNNATRIKIMLNELEQRKLDGVKLVNKKYYEDFVCSIANFVSSINSNDLQSTKEAVWNYLD